MQTRQQERAALAYGRIKLMLEHTKKKEKEEYGRWCLHLPALIHQCGLCQTVAFLEAKGASKNGFAPRKALEDLKGVMASEHLEDDARTKPVGEYMRLTREALRAAEWMKRYAEAVLKVELGTDGSKAGEVHV